MEAVYLLCSVASTFVRSAALSLLLAVRSVVPLLLPFFFAASSNPKSDPHPAVLLYQGHVRHVRRKPVEHSFEYPVRYALFDLDRAPQQCSSHLSADAARTVAATNGPVFLLTIPASVGYEQNPLSVYYCYHKEEENEGSPPAVLKMCIAEVTNTPWGERVMFEFKPGSDLVAKPLHVSPFMDMLGNWNIRASAPGEELSIAISVQHPTQGTYFTATLTAKRVGSPSSALSMARYFWLMPHKVAVWIYLNALQLWWKNVAFIGHPRYENPSYRDDALLRDGELCAFRHNKQSGNDYSDGNRVGKTRRWCLWVDAKWPWS